MAYNELVGLFRSIQESFQKIPKYKKALLGDVLGDVQVPNRPDYAYARFARGSTESFEVFNKNAPFVNGWPVLIGEFPWMPGLTQVVGTDWEAYEQSGWGDGVTTNEPHAPTHVWRDQFIGADPLDIYMRSIAPGRGYSIGATGSVVYVNAFEYGTGTVWPGTPGVDLQPVMGALATGTAQLAGIYVQGSDNTLAIVTGTTSVDTLAFDPPSVLFPIENTVIPIARVRLYGGQAGVAERDFRDARRLFDLPAVPREAAGGSGALPLPGKITLLDSSEGVATEYSDFSSARAASAAGDVIILGIGTFTCNDQTNTNGVNIFGVDQELSILSQTADATCLNLGTGNYAANFTVSMSINSASARTAVIAASGNLSNITISGANAGGGTVTGLSISGTSFVHNCNIAGDGDAVFVSGGTCKISDSNLDGSSDLDVNGSTTVYLGMTILVNGDLANFGTVIGAYQDGSTGRIVPGNSIFIPFTSTNDLLKISSHSGTLFSALINGAPSGTSVVYDTVTGNEDSIKPAATGELAKLRLYNVTQDEYALIEGVDTGTNTITVTSSADITTWANNDAIQVNSNLNTDSVSGQRFFEVELDTAEIDALAKILWVQVQMIDTGAANQISQIHPQEAGASSKRLTLNTYITSGGSYFYVPINLISGRFMYLSNASGAGTKSDTLRMVGYEIEAT